MDHAEILMDYRVRRERERDQKGVMAFLQRTNSVQDTQSLFSQMEANVSRRWFVQTSGVLGWFYSPQVPKENIVKNADTPRKSPFPSAPSRYPHGTPTDIKRLLAAVRSASTIPLAATASERRHAAERPVGGQVSSLFHRPPEAQDATCRVGFGIS